MAEGSVVPGQHMLKTMSSSIQACCQCPDPISDIQALLEALHISSDCLCYVLPCRPAQIGLNA